MSFFTELKRRNVIRVGLAYLLFAWVLLQAADFALDLIDAPNWVIQALFVIAAIGLPAVAVFAWVFEMTPEGIKREADIDRSQSITPHTGRKLDRVIIGALALAVAYLLVDKLYLGEHAGAEPGGAAATQVAAATPDPEATDTTPQLASVAVLPFVNMSNDPDNEYFSDGLTETLLHMLAQLPDLKVAARTSSFAFKGRNTAIEEVAATLGVAHVLEGSVQKAGDRVRVTAQLIRAEDGFHVWSQNYTEPLEDIFAIQDTIAGQVADALGASLLEGPNSGLQSIETSNLSAYEQYLKGLEQQAIASYASLNQAEAHFQQALLLDAKFTDARLALIRNYMEKNMTGMIDRETLHQAARPLLQTVTREHPDNRHAEALDSLLEGRFSLQTNTHASAVESVERARELLAWIPTDSLFRELVASGYVFVNNDPQTALDLLQAGLLIDPLDPSLHIQTGNVLTRLKRYEEAREQLLRAIELRPESPAAYGYLANLERELGDLPAAMEWTRINIEMDPLDHELPNDLAWDFYGLGLTEAAEPWYQRVQSLAPGSALARALEVTRAVERGETEYAIEAAAAAIRDQIGNRRGAMFIVVNAYAGLMMEAGRAEDAYRFLVATRPEIENFSTLPADFQGRQMQRFAIVLMSSFATFEQRLDAWSQYKEAQKAEGWGDFAEGNRMRTWDLLITGDVQGAVEHELQHRLDDPVADALWRHRVDLVDLYRPLLEDPRMAAALAERSREVKRVREDVLAMLEQPEWAP